MLNIRKLRLREMNILVKVTQLVNIQVKNWNQSILILEAKALNHYAILPSLNPERLVEVCQE